MVLNQLTTKVVLGNNAVLVPALGDAWTSVCSYRITLYRQRLSPDFCDRAQDVRFAYFQKCEGIVVKDEDAKNVPFLITVVYVSAVTDIRILELKMSCFLMMLIRTSADWWTKRAVMALKNGDVS